MRNDIQLSPLGLLELCDRVNAGPHNWGFFCWLVSFTSSHVFSTTLQEIHLVLFHLDLYLSIIRNRCVALWRPTACVSWLIGGDALIL